MLNFFQQQWENFTTQFFLHFLFSQKDIRQLLDQTDPAQLNGAIGTSIGKPDVIFTYAVYKTSFPTAPVSNHPRINDLLKVSASAMVIASYEWLKDDLKSKGKFDLKNLPSEIQLFRHLRNAAAHNNTFNFNPIKR